MGFETIFHKSDENIGGGFYERNLVGAVDIEEPSYEQEIKKLQDEARQNGWKISGERYLPFPHAIELAKRFQDGNDPINPQKDFARELRLSVAEKLGLSDDKELDQLRLFSAVGGEKSPADFFHGIDFFISFASKPGKEVIVTGDITRSQKKMQKADILISGNISAPGQDDFNEQKYLSMIDRYAEKAVAILNEKIEEEKFWETDMRRDMGEKNLRYFRNEPPADFEQPQL